MTEKNSYIIEDWWTDSQKELVRDSSKIWEKKTFKATSGFWIQEDGGKLLGKTSQHEELPPDTVIDTTAWDHEHCELCRKTISDKENYQHEGYTDGKEWLCNECYK
jgi:hypothetical protein